MKAAYINQYSAAGDALQLGVMPKPPIAADQVLIRVRASSVNPIDCLMQTGYGKVVFEKKRKPKFPLILGRDCVGSIESVGAKVRAYQPGDDVFCAVAPTLQGAYCEYLAMPAHHVVPKPSHLTDDEAAAIPYVAVTVWNALGKAGLSPLSSENKRVLVRAGGGGTGPMAIQLLKAWGAHVVTTAASENIALLERLGADDIIDYEKQDFAAALPCNFDVVFDNLGIDEEKCLAVLKKNAAAQYVTIVHPVLTVLNEQGLLRGAFSLLRTIRRLRKKCKAENKGYHWGMFTPNIEALNGIRQYAEMGKLKPALDSVYPLADIAKAHERVTRRHLNGKVVIRIGDSRSD